MEKYRRIYRELYFKIKTGEIPQGSKLPTETALAAQYGVSKITAKAALDLLKRDGLVIRKRRLGTVVRSGMVNAAGEKLIAIVFSGFDQLDARIAGALKQPAAEKNVKLAFFDTEMNAAREREILSFLLSERIAGLILMPVAEDSNLDLISAFAVRKIPLVYMDFPSYGAQAPAVSSDNFGAMYELVRYLIGLGHRRIGFFPYSANLYPTGRDRFRGYAKALTDSGIPIEEDLLFPVSARSTYQLMSSVSAEEMRAGEEFFERYEALSLRPSALVCINDLSAHAVLTVAKQRGVQIPRRLSVTGFDNLAVASKSDITTVAQNFAEIAKHALFILLRSAEGAKEEAYSVKIKTVLIRRGTVASPEEG